MQMLLAACCSGCARSAACRRRIVSGLAGIGRTHLSAIERGERKPTLETFYRIGEALHMRPSAVLAEIEAELDKAQDPI